MRGDNSYRLKITLVILWKPMKYHCQPWITMLVHEVLCLLAPLCLLAGGAYLIRGWCHQSYLLSSLVVRQVFFQTCSEYLLKNFLSDLSPICLTDLSPICLTKFCWKPQWLWTMILGGWPWCLVVDHGLFYLGQWQNRKIWKFIFGNSPLYWYFPSNDKILVKPMGTDFWPVVF